MQKNLCFLLLITFLSSRAATSAIPKDGFALTINQEQPCLVNLKAPLLQASSVYVKRSQCIRNFTVQTVTGVSVPVRFYDRKRDKVLILGQGLPAPKESMEYYAELFADYDIVLFDYRWCGNYASSLAKALCQGSPVQKILLDQEEEVQAVIVWTCKHKNYQAMVGLGECYSTFLFAKVQADATVKTGKGPFTHLIFDSCWYSLRLFAERIFFDPLLSLSPQVGGAPWIVKAITNSSIVKRPLLWATFACMRDISVAPYLAGVQCPVLYIHGRKDLFVPQEHFKKLWDATNIRARAALLTPYRHCDNLRMSSVYKTVCDLFIGCSCVQEFQNVCATHHLLVF